MPGPPPDANAIRRNKRVGLTELPAEGRKGRTPKWPLPKDPKRQAQVDMLEEVIADLEDRDLDEGLTRTERTKLSRTRERLRIAIATMQAIQETEGAIWRELWHTPQAVMWEKLGWTRDVAIYARLAAARDIGDMEAGKEARAWSDRLGLNPKALRALMWTIVEDQVTEQKNARRADATAQKRRRNIKAVDTGS